MVSLLQRARNLAGGLLDRTDWDEKLVRGIKQGAGRVASEIKTNPQQFFPLTPASIRQGAAAAGYLAQRPEQPVRLAGRFTGGRIFEPLMEAGREIRQPGIAPKVSAGLRTLGAGLSATPLGAIFGLGEAGVSGTLRSLRTRQPLKTSIEEAVSNPYTGVGTTGTGLTGPLGTGIDIAAGFVSPGGLSRSAKLVRTGERGLPAKFAGTAMKLSREEVGQFLTRIRKGKLNVRRLKVSNKIRGTIRASDQGPVTVIGNKELIEEAKSTLGARVAMTDKQMRTILSKRLNSRQHVVSLAKEFELLKKSKASEEELIKKFSQLIEQTHIAQQESTLAGRQLQAQNIIADELATPQQKVLALLNNAGVKRDEYIKDAIKVNWDDSKQVVEFYRKYVSPSLRDVLTEYRYTNMLSSPLTHIKNIFANLLQTGIVTPVEKTTSGGLDWVKSTVTGSERKYYTSDGIKYAKAYYKVLPEAWKNFAETLSGKQINLKPDLERVPAFTQGIGKLYTTPLTALEAADMFFVTLTKSGEKSIIRGTTEAMAEKSAKDIAEYRLFRNAFDPNNRTGQGYLLSIWDRYNSFVQQMRRLPGGKWIVPFLQTPTNILKQGVEYSPLGILTLPGSKNKIEQLSKTIIGGAVFMGTYGVLNSTEFTWEVPTGKKERELFYAAGLKPYHIKIGNKWYSYSKLGPLSYPIAMAAALRYAEKNNLPTDETNKISIAIGGMLQFFSDQSYVKQLGDLMDKLKTGEGIVGGGKAELTNLISQLVPYRSFQGWLARLIDPVVRKQTGIISSLKAQIPFLSKTIPSYYNRITGGPSTRNNNILNAFSPITISTPKEKDIKLWKYTGNAKKAYQNLNSLPPQEASAIFNKIKKTDPAMARAIVKVSNDIKLGVTSEEAKTRNMEIGSGERAYTIMGEFDKLKTPEEKSALWQDYVKKKIITKEVAKQLKMLLK